MLDTFETIKVAVGYKDPQTGEELESFPASLELLERVEVIYKELPGWHHETVHDGHGAHPHTVATTTPTGHTYTSRAGP